MSYMLSSDLVILSLDKIRYFIVEYISLWQLVAVLSGAFK